MITISGLVRLVDPDLPLDPDSLSERLRAAESRARQAFEIAHTRCFWDNVVALNLSPLHTELQPLGAIDRIAWATSVYSKGEVNDPQLAQTLFDVLAEALVLNLCLANTGAPLGLASGAPEVDIHVRDLLARCSSRRITWGWVNRELLEIIASLVNAVPAWGAQMPGLRHEEIESFFAWMDGNWLSRRPRPLVPSQPGAALAREMLLGPVSFSNASDLFDAREYVTRPIIETDRGLYTTTAGCAYGESYQAVLERIDSIFLQSKVGSSGSLPNRGDAFEALVRELFHRYLGPSALAPAPYSISVTTSRGRANADIDALWLGGSPTTLLVVECKSYIPSRNSSNAATKLDAERAKIIDQIERRAESLAARLPIATAGGAVDTTTWPTPMLLGVSMDPMMGPEVLRSSHGHIHAFQIEGLVVALRAFPDVAELQQYLRRRADLIGGAPAPLTDEIDIIRAYLLGHSAVVSCNLSNQQSNHIQADRIPAGREWCAYLTKVLSAID